MIRYKKDYWEDMNLLNYMRELCEKGLPSLVNKNLLQGDILQSNQCCL